MAAFRFAGQQKQNSKVGHYHHRYYIGIIELKCNIGDWVFLSLFHSRTYSRKAAHKQWKMSVEVVGVVQALGKEHPKPPKCFKAP